MNRSRIIGFVAALLLLGSSACADLDVTNPNAADRQRALTTPADVVGLISGAYSQWWEISGAFFGGNPGPFLANQAFQMSSWPANEGMVFFSSFPRPQVPNSVAHEFFENWAGPWKTTYRMLGSLNDGLRALENDPEIREELGAEEVRRARAFGKFMQGLGHGTIALMYTGGFDVNETMEIEDVRALGPEQFQDSEAILQASLGYLDEAIALSEGAGFEIPARWMSVRVPADQLARIAHSFKARFRAAYARTPEEREAVDWDAVLADVNAGVTEDWEMEFDGTFSGDWFNSMFATPGFSAWEQLSYFILGMADQSGRYQEWLSIPVEDREPNLPDGDPFIIETPDQRFPQGTTLDEQRENPGTMYAVPESEGEITPLNPTPSWSQPARGTYRWSYYVGRIHLPFIIADGGPVPEITRAEMDLLAAEAHLRTGSPGEAAAIVNQYRTDAGLSATDAGGSNADCVPRLPDGECGGLEEMLKWEKRLNTSFRGLFGASWYFEGRGWGDLYECTQLEFPVPEDQAIVHGLPVESTGGCGGPSASPGSVYDFPGESGGG